VTATLTAQSVCDRVAERLRRECGAGRFERCFGCTQLEVRADGALLVRTPSEMYGKWLAGRFLEALRSAAAAEGATGGVVFEHAPAEPAPEVGRAAPIAATKREATPAPARPAARVRYSLDEFVVSDGNRLGHAMAVRLADPSAAPPSTLLFLHGPCGVGKTHLLSGLAERFRSSRSGARVRVFTGEEFTNQYIASVRTGRIEEFRASIRKADLLCIDDVHFLAGKAGTQQEFMHTFDALDLGGSRVALASDAAPRDIENLSARIVSRCMSGMVVEVKPPDDATRRVIIGRLASRQGVRLDPSAIDLIAASCPGSVRDAEGVLTTIRAILAVMPEAAPDGVAGAALVRRALGGRAAEGRLRRPVRVPAIAEIVCRSLGVDLEDIRRRSRHRRVVLARSLVAFLARELTTQSYPEIAQAIGCGSHSTMIEGVARMKRMLSAGEACDGDAHGTPVPAADLVDRLRRAVASSAAPLAS
jgi:chromosomal replication initiator protein